MTRRQTQLRPSQGGKLAAPVGPDAETVARIRAEKLPLPRGGRSGAPSAVGITFAPGSTPALTVGKPVEYVSTDVPPRGHAYKVGDRVKLRDYSSTYLTEGTTGVVAKDYGKGLLCVRFPPSDWWSITADLLLPAEPESKKWAPKAGDCVKLRGGKGALPDGAVGVVAQTLSNRAIEAAFLVSNWPTVWVILEEHEFLPADTKPENP